jgi:alpha-beta hydrolase superfamily lysophospholipase
MSWFSHVLDVSSSLLIHRPSSKPKTDTNLTYGSKTRPHVIVVPGGCHTQHYWRFFKASMESAGYDVTTQRLIANIEDGPNPLPNAMSKSIAAVRDAVVKKIEDEQDVIVIGHSAGGAVISGALVGLAKKG